MDLTRKAGRVRNAQSRRRSLLTADGGCQNKALCGKRVSIAWIHCWKALKMTDNEVDIEIVESCRGTREKVWRAWRRSGH